MIKTEVQMVGWVNEWMSEESDPSRLGVLATVDEEGNPHTRTVTIREIGEDGVLFFTQKGSEKVEEMKKNAAVSLTMILFEKKRQVTFQGTASPISEEENVHYWKGYPQPAQLRFCVYGPKSGEEIVDNAVLDEELGVLTEKYGDVSPERPEAYVGYRIAPKRIDLYRLNGDRISDSFVARKKGKEWELVRVVP